MAIIEMVDIDYAAQRAAALWHILQNAVGPGIWIVAARRHSQTSSNHLENELPSIVTPAPLDGARRWTPGGTIGIPDDDSVTFRWHCEPLPSEMEWWHVRVK